MKFFFHGKKDYLDSPSYINLYSLFKDEKTTLDLIKIKKHYDKLDDKHHEKMLLISILGYFPSQTKEDRERSVKLLADFFKGGQVRIEDDGDVYRKIYDEYVDETYDDKKGKGRHFPKPMKARISSHPSTRNKKQIGFTKRGKILNELLIFELNRSNAQKQKYNINDSHKDLKTIKRDTTYSCMQLEPSPWHGTEGNKETFIKGAWILLKNKVLRMTLNEIEKDNLDHAKSGCKYFLTLFKKNIGPYGASVFTDKNPHVIDKKELEYIKDHLWENSKFWHNFLFNPKIFTMDPEIEDHIYMGIQCVDKIYNIAQTHAKKIKGLNKVSFFETIDYLLKCQQSGQTILVDKDASYGYIISIRYKEKHKNVPELIKFRENALLINDYLKEINAKDSNDCKKIITNIENILDYRLLKDISKKKTKHKY